MIKVSDMSRFSFFLGGTSAILEESGVHARVCYRAEEVEEEFGVEHAGELHECDKPLDNEQGARPVELLGCLVVVRALPAAVRSCHDLARRLCGARFSNLVPGVEQGPGCESAEGGEEKRPGRWVYVACELYQLMHYRIVKESGRNLDGGKRDRG